MFQSVRRLAAAALGALVLAAGMTSAPAAHARAGIVVFAPLAGPSLGGIDPIGRGRYRARPQDSDLSIELFNVNLPNFTPCTAWVDGVPVQTTPLFAGIALFPGFNSGAGDVVPVGNPGAVLTITVPGFGAILSGVFGGAAPGLPLPLTNLAARLTGSAITRVVPDGAALYTTFAGLNNQTYTLFTCTVTAVNLRPGTVLKVFRGTQLLGLMTLNAAQGASLTLSDATGNPAPALAAGDVITVKSGTRTLKTIVKGTLN